MRLQKNRKSSDHIHITVYSKMKLLQPNKIAGIHIENIHISHLKATWSKQSFYSDASSFLQKFHMIWTRDENPLT